MKILPKSNRIIITAAMLFTGTTGAFFLERVSSQIKDPEKTLPAAPSISIHAKGRGFPRVSFENGREMSSVSDESNANAAPARQLASADFDSDGVADLVTVDSGGSVRIYRGKLDTIFPQASDTEDAKKSDGVVSPPFFDGRNLFVLPVAPDFFESGDFNADGHSDVIAAAKGGTSLYVSIGDGAGQFVHTTEFNLPGAIAALATGEIGRADGQTDVAVSVNYDSKDYLLVFEHPTGAFARTPEKIELRSPADDIVLGFLESDSFADIAVAGGNCLTVVRGRGHVYPWDMIEGSEVTRPAPVVETRFMPFQIAGMEIGYFTERRGQSLVLLSTDGTLSTLDARPIPHRPVQGLDQLSPAKFPMPTAETAQPFSRFRQFSEPMRPLKDESELIYHPELVPGDVTDVDAYRAELAEKRRAVLASMSPEARAAKDTFDKQNAEISRQRAREGFLQAISPGPADKLSSWTLNTIASDARLAALSVLDTANKLVRVRVSDSGRDELAMIDPTSNQIHLLIRENARRSNDPRANEIVSLDSTSAPVALLPMRLNMDALSDLVVLSAGNSAPSTVLTSPAAVFTVTTLADEDDGSCGSPCSLREAIDAANNNAGTDSIEFAVTGIMQPDSALPEITFPVTINGTNAPTPQVEINGSLADDGDSGLRVNAANVVIRRLSVTGFRRTPPDPDGATFGGQGITIYNFAGQTLSAFNTVEGCYLGTGLSGSSDKGNESAGLQIFDSDNNVIGGNTTAARNVISGNGRGEIRDSTIRGAGVSIVDGRFIVLRGNYIGTNSSGTSALSNSLGVFAVGSNNEYGGDPAGSMNVISGNRHLLTIPFDPDGCDGPGLYEVSVFNQTSGEWITHHNNIRGNRVGTNALGTAAIGNCRTGIYTSPRHSSVIGSITANGRNLVSGNDEGGIYCTLAPPLTVIPFAQVIDDSQLGGLPPPEGLCTIRGNNVGTNATGTAVIPNTYNHFILQGGMNFLNPGGGLAINNSMTLSTIGDPGGTSSTSCTGFCNLAAGEITTVPNALEFETGIVAHGDGSIGIFNNYAGVNITGTAALPNGEGGIAAQGDVTVGAIASGPGGTQISLGNLASGNEKYGIGAGGSVRPGGSGLAFVQANLIGTDRTGLTAIPNGYGLGIGNGNGVSLIGGAQPAEGNVISGNTGDGLFFRDGGSSAPTRNNLIGVNKNGQPLGNGGDGVVLTGTFDYIGDQNAGNIIANNGGNGVLVSREFSNSPNPSGNRIKYNSIYNNGGLGIDLSTDTTFPIEGDGVTPNDCGDTDTGPHGLQNFPVLTAPVFNPDGTVTVGGAFGSDADTTYTLDFYSNSAADPSDYGEGETYIGSTQVTTDVGGIASFIFTSTVQVAPGLKIAATAYDLDGNMSEFSCYAGQCSIFGVTIEEQSESARAAAGGGCQFGITVNISTDESDPNPADGICDVDLGTDGQQCSLRAAIETANAAPGQDFIAFNIPGSGVQTITPASDLPAITERVRINATTQPGYADTPLIELRGINLPTGIHNGIVFSTGSNGSLLKGFSINTFRGSNIVLQSDENHIEDCFIGVAANGQTSYPSNHQVEGITVTGSKNVIGGTRDTTRGRNIIVDHLGVDILITGASASENVVTGNDIGFLLDGSELRGGFNGIEIKDAGSLNRIGGGTPGEKNRITALSNAIQVENTTSASVGGDNIIRGNEIVRSVTGIDLESTGGNQVIGNAILQNGNGIEIDNSNFAADPNAIDQNKIFSNIVKGAGFGNSIGIRIVKGVNNQIGSIMPGELNVIAGNTIDGVKLEKDSQVNVIEGNYIGTDIAGSGGDGNGVGVNILGSNNRVVKNVISGNGPAGVIVGNQSEPSPPPLTNIIDQNRIGVAATGDTAVSNTIGVWLETGTSIVTNNLIAWNSAYGLLVEGPSTGNLIVGNTVKNNLSDGLLIRDGSSGNTVANTPDSQLRALLSGPSPTVSIFSNNGGNGLKISGNSLNNLILGLKVFGNTENGILIEDSTNTKVGDIGQGNEIAGNLGDGIKIVNSNFAELYTNALGYYFDQVQVLIGNEGNGISAYQSRNISIGELNDQRNNIIILSKKYGILVDQFSELVKVQSDLVGTTIRNIPLTSTKNVQAPEGQNLGNVLGGIRISNGSRRNTIGGPDPQAGNVIANNGGPGVWIDETAGDGNLVDPNAIYGNTGLGIDLGIIGRTENDPSDADVGPNKLQNYPVIGSKQVVNDELILGFYVDSAPENSSYGMNGIYIEFFKSDMSGEGERFVGSTFYTLADYQNGTPGTKTVNLGPIATLGITPTDPITATATDAEGNTSEFFPPFAPTAAGVSISGRIVTSGGTGIGKTQITLTDAGGEVRTVVSNGFGYYRFDDIPAGQTYIIAVMHKRYYFDPPSRVLNVAEELTDIDFIASP